MNETIICYGDSNTFGYDPASFLGGRYPYGQRWTDILAQKTGHLFVNEGLCGREIPGTDYERNLLGRRLCDWQQGEKPVSLWIQLGTNDLLMHPHQTAKEVAGRMESLLLALQQQPAIQSGCIRLRLLSPPHMQPGTWVTDERILTEAKKMDACYQDIAEQLSVPVTLTGDWPVPLAFDGVHFTKEGHRVFAEHLYAAIFS